MLVYGNLFILPYVYCLDSSLYINICLFILLSQQKYSDVFTNVFVNIWCLSQKARQLLQYLYNFLYAVPNPNFDKIRFSLNLYLIYFCTFTYHQNLPLRTSYLLWPVSMYSTFVVPTRYASTSFHSPRMLLLSDHNNNNIQLG